MHPGPGRLPTVLMLHGSGPVDRDENMKGQRIDAFNAIAAHLAHSGIASVRYDKRGCGASTGDFLRAGFHDLVDDAMAWIAWLQGADFADSSRLFVLGHSEGCLIATHAIVKRPEIAGAVLLCPFIEDIDSLLMRQARQIERDIAQAPGFGGWLQRRFMRCFGAPTEIQRRTIELVRASTTDTVRRMGQTLSAKWLRELLAIDAVKLFRQVACPLLLIGGEKDVQCDPDDLDRIARIVGGRVDAHVIPGLTHLLRRDDRPATLLGSHAVLAQPLDAELLELIEAWFGRLSPRLEVTARSAGRLNAAGPETER